MLNCIFLQKDKRFEEKLSNFGWPPVLNSRASGSEVEIISITELQSSHLTINKQTTQHMETE